MNAFLHFLVDASLPRATSARIEFAGHQATDVRDIGLGVADDRFIADHAKSNQLCLITRNLDFGNIHDYPPHGYFGIVVVRAPDGASRATVLRLVDQFLGQIATLPLLVGRLVIVETSRIRIRS